MTQTPVEIEQESVWDEFDKLQRELGGDIRFFLRTKRLRANQHWRRAYCRAVSAYLEAISSWMARYTIIFYHPAQLADGERQTLEAPLSALERAFHALDLFTNTAGAESPLERQSAEWIALRNMIRIRNRIVHPRRSQDVLITDDDLSAIELAGRVVRHLFSESLLRSGRAMIKRYTEIQEVYDRLHPQPRRANTDLQSPVLPGFEYLTSVDIAA
jgi:hypothetical protein